MFRYLVLLFCLVCLASARGGKGGGRGGSGGGRTGSGGSGVSGSGLPRANCVLGYNCTLTGLVATFNFTVRNALVNPLFDNTLTLPLGKNAPLIRYMESATLLNSVGFESFTVTYYSSTGYVVEAVNGVYGVWQLSNINGVVDLGASLYVPQLGDDVVLELIQGV